METWPAGATVGMLANRYCIAVARVRISSKGKGELWRTDTVVLGSDASWQAGIGREPESEPMFLGRNRTRSHPKLDDSAFLGIILFSLSRHLD